MRVANFRDDVLWTIAHKMGIDPNFTRNGQGIMPDQADAWVSFVNSWVRRLYPAQDIPGWTKIIQRSVPSNHIVSYENPGSTDPTSIIGRVLKVYLVDPATTPVPFDTPFRLRDDGIFVGLEHGPTVWIKYLEESPQFSAEEWDPDESYAKEKVIYSRISGHCYKSKVNGNLGHDPSVTFQPPTNVNVVQEPIKLTTEIIQQLTSNDPGIATQPKIIDAYLTTSVSGIPPNPPPNLSQFYIPVLNPDGSLLASATELANGTNTLATITTNLRNTLAGLPALSGFTITADTVNFVIRFSSLSDYYLIRPQGGNAPFYVPNGGPIYYLPALQVQAYIPAVTGSAGVPQIIQITLTENDVVPGATYKLTFKDLAGVDHSVSYIALASDNINNILASLISAIGTAQATDAFFKGIVATLNTVGSTATFSTMQKIGLNADITFPGSPYWKLVPFPFDLVDQVVRGAYDDALKSDGQADKAGSEEQAVPTEATAVAGRILAPKYDALTDQQGAR